ncbi:MAG: aromatic ring-hydroxylating dioxygenase subunit alpha [Hahellaceae bacterium]|nr:aromatic ring-hydroxylating dioxygenase subunit alpha [Hahellaceae bacterium]MCP5168872.1 aromatic ring-hydroxylating dioxygenase subunit alpha [Hahellaceae bacterium]
MTASSRKQTMRERCGTLKNYWYAAARAETLKDKPVSVVILETRIALWRKKDGTAQALRDRCSHRNVRLSEGKVQNNCLKCPYHGWTFDAEGQCVNVPSEGPDGKAFAGRKVEDFPVKEVYGLIWVWMGGEVAPDKEPFPMPHYDEKGWNRYYMETDFNNGVTALVENFMDVPHTVFVHEGWFRDRKRLKVDSTVERTEDSVLVTYHAQDAIGFTEKVLNPTGLPMTHTDKFYMPNNTRVDYIYGDNQRGFVITSTCTPVSEFETRVFTLICYKFGLANHLFKTFLPWYTRQVIQQDVDIMENQGKALKETEASFKSTPADTLHVFIESLREYAESNNEGEAPKPMVREVAFWI